MTVLAALAVAASVLVGAATSAAATSHTGGSPFGQFDGAYATPAGIYVWGWVIDPDTTASTFAWVTVDGNGRHVSASGSRPDVGAAFPASGPNHGFTATIPASRGSHQVCVAAHNLGPGSHTHLGCRTVTVIAPGSPIGNFESAVGVVGGVDVKGWVIDPELGRETFAWVTTNNAGRHIVANVNRPDVGRVFPGYGPDHGYRSTIPTAPGLQEVCVTGHNVGIGQHTPFGCKIAVAGSETCPPFGSTGRQGEGSPGFDLSSIYGSTMRVGRNACFDRFVFEFAGSGQTPGWEAVPVRTVLQSETSDPVSPPVAGTWFIVVRFGAWDTGEPLGQPASAPKRIFPTGLEAIKEARTLGGFEGISEVVVGVDHPRPYRVTWLENPHRLVVDVFTGIA